MSSHSKVGSVYGPASHRVGVQQPFRSPLRTSHVLKSADLKPLNRSPTCFSSTNVPCENSNAPNDEDSLSKQHIQKPSTSDYTTPKKPVITTSRQLNCHQKKTTPRQFSVPFRSPLSNASSSQCVLSKEEELNKLLAYEREIDEEIALLSDQGYKLEELKGHIDNLHKYNEIKDSAQLVLGRLAELQGVTVKKMHEKYNVPADEG